MTDEVSDKFHAAEDRLLSKKALIRNEIADDTIHTDYKDAPWQVEECAPGVGGGTGCACIVYQGTYQPFDKSQTPPIQYVADAETPAFAKWIALMHPGLAEPLAEVFCEAHKMAEKYEALGRCDDGTCDDFACALVKKLLKVAEVLTAGDDDD